MRYENIKRKPCECPSEEFDWVKKSYESKEGPYKIIHYFEIKQCSKHNNTWGRRRKEEEIISCFNPIKEIQFKDKDIEFFKSIISKIWENRVNEKVWKKKLNSYYKNQNIEEISNGFIQKGLVIKNIEIIQKSNSQKTYFLLTDQGRVKLKELTQFLDVDEQIGLGIEKIKKTLKESGLYSNEKKKIILDLIKSQLDLLETGNHQWVRKDGVKIKPSNSAVNPPKYLILLYGFCTWVEIYRDSLTLREVSARAFQESEIPLDIDPSKMLDRYSKDLNSIIENFSSKECEELGLILTLDSFTFSGELILEMLDGNSIIISGPSVSFSNLSYQNIDKIKLSAKRVFLIENYSVFAQLVLDNWTNQNNALLIFIKGMGVSGRFKKTILKKIIEHNPKCKYFVWLDYDLGGCTIFREILRILNVKTMKLVRIPPHLKVPFREIHTSQLDTLKVLYNHTDIPELKEYAKFILDNGKIEQEYLLEWYDEILHYNYH